MSEARAEIKNKRSTKPCWYSSDSIAVYMPSLRNTDTRQKASHSDFQSNGDWINMSSLSVNTAVIHLMCDDDLRSA